MAQSTHGDGYASYSHLGRVSKEEEELVSYIRLNMPAEAEPDRVCVLRAAATCKCTSPANTHTSAEDILWSAQTSRSGRWTR